MNNKQVAHLWANKSRQQASGSHFFFDGDTIYSYGKHFPIARHHKGVILFTSESYSVTTSKHKGYVRGACSHLKRFTVSDVMAKPSAKDVKRYRDSIQTLSQDLSRARDPQWKLQMLQGEVDDANDFCDTFGFKTRFSMPDEKTLAVLKEKSRIASQKKAKQTAERNARIERDNAEAIQQWLAGEKDSLPYSINKVFLRGSVSCQELNGDKVPVMQTSKGATIPLAEAEKAFRFVILKRATGWHRNGDTFAVGEFQLDAVNEQGVICGCHRVEWSEIERFAKSQGWLKQESSVA